MTGRSDGPASAVRRPQRASNVARSPGDAKAATRFDTILNGPILRTLVKLSGPVILVTLAQVFVSVLEAYWVSRLGTDAIAGVALVLPLFVLMGTMSNGGIGGGVSAAISRAMGAGKRGEAEQLLFHTVFVALAFGAGFTLIAFTLGRDIYAVLGGQGATLDAALIFSNWAFGGSMVVWLVNLAGSALRGSGEVKLPAIVSVSGALLLIPLSPALIFGFGPLPALGLAGAGVATIVYYLGALLAYGVYLMRGHGALRLRPAPLTRAAFAAILGVGSLSAVGTLATALTTVTVTGSVGQFGSAAIAGYGIASRLESLLVPPLFGLGTGVITMVAAALGAGAVDRARRVTFTGVGITFAIAAAIGLFVAVLPGVWMNVFTHDTAVLAVGSSYLRVVGLSYGALGITLGLYFAFQGWGRMRWPFVTSVLRLIVTLATVSLLVGAGFALETVFLAVSIIIAVFALLNGLGMWSIAKRYERD